MKVRPQLPARKVAAQFAKGASLYTLAASLDRSLGDVEDAVRRRLVMLERKVKSWR